MTTWLLFTYEVPHEPSARRVYVWRKLKRMGAILVNGAAWVLPATPHTQERFQWLAAEVNEMEGGEATVWEARQLYRGKESALIQLFVDQVNASYQEILTGLDDEIADLATLSKQYQQAATQDYFHSTLGQQVRAALLKRRGDSEL